MALYEIVIGNNGDDRNYSKLVLSNEPLHKENVGHICNLDDWEYILSVSIPCIMINAYDEDEFYKLNEIRRYY